MQSIAWFPLFEYLLPICPDESNFSLLVLGTVAATLARNFLLKKEIERIAMIPMWNSNLSSDKRQALFVVASSVRPSDLNKFDELVTRYINVPTKIAAACMYGITNVIHSQLTNQDKMYVMAALTIFIIGGIGVGGTRHGNLSLDCIFRFVLAAGFIGILHYLGEASDVVIMKGI